MAHVLCPSQSPGRVRPQGCGLLEMTRPALSGVRFLGGSRGPSLHHSCFLRAWMRARHGRHSVTIGGLPGSPANIGLRGSPLRFHSEEALGGDRLPGFHLKSSHLWGLPLETGESKTLPGCFCMVGWRAGEDGVKTRVNRRDVALGGGGTLLRQICIYLRTRHICPHLQRDT